MDRQQVEYIPRNESEEEYDEVLNQIWLLKGKRKRTNEKHDSGYENLDEKKGKMENYDKERPDEEYKGHYMEREEEEEDDDDDEDGDLSKYHCQSEEAATEVRRGRGGEAVGLMIVLHHHQDLDQARIPRLLETVPRAAINRTVGLQVPIGAVQLVHDVRLRLLREAEVVAVLVTTADLESIAVICIVAEKNLIAVANLPPIQVRPVEIRTGTVDIDDSDDAENEI
ncbi:hypothetical protein D917_05238 [Trichinella nativa]|uniref:Uncharacterized protein n=1 Tax=Trichinella nativa TaxID=6335 RepID=A0A1Y3F1Q0_9BILA|nr:hypothetical protein D917_05238 [Trichinella nativa]